MEIGDLFLGVQADLKDFTKDVQKGAEAVRSALEMADLFSNLRAAAAR